MRNFTGGIIICVLSIILLLMVTVYADESRRIKVLFNDIAVTVSGEPIGKETILYNGTTYVPLRVAAEMFGMDVRWVESTNTAYIESAETYMYNKDGLSEEAIQVFDALALTGNITREQLLYLVQYQRIYDKSRTHADEFTKKYDTGDFSGAMDELVVWRSACVEMSVIDIPDGWGFIGGIISDKFRLWGDAIEYGIEACRLEGNDANIRNFIDGLNAGNENDDAIRDYIVKLIKGE